MTPSGVLCRIFGAKNVLSVGLLGNAATMALLPLVAVRGVYPTSALLVIKGLCQSCLESTHTTLKRCWMPRCLGPERVWAVRVTRWGQFLGQMAASLITPWVANRFGWRAVPLSFGCATGLYTLVWHAAFAETPMQWRGNMSATEKQLLLESDEMKVTAAAAAAGGSAGGAASQRDGGSFPFHLLWYPSCVVPMMLHVGNNCSQYTLQYWGPTMLADMFAASPQQQGNIIFAATLASVIGSFAVAGFENLLLVRQLLPSHMLLRRLPFDVRPWILHAHQFRGRCAVVTDRSVAAVGSAWLWLIRLHVAVFLHARVWHGSQPTAGDTCVLVAQPVPMRDGAPCLALQPLQGSLSQK